MIRLLRQACFLALHCASWIAPEEERHEWLREWSSELWHVANDLQHESFKDQVEILRFVRGAFPDAFWMNVHALRTYGFRLPSLRSPAQCLLALLLLTTFVASLAYLLPGTRSIVLPLPYENPRGLVLITPDTGRPSTSAGSQIRLKDFRSWNRDAPHIFSSLAFYQIMEKRIHLGHGVSQSVSVVRGSGNLFSMLGFESPSGTTHLPQLFLSDALWHSTFHANPQIKGQTLVIAGEWVQIAGVLPPDAWRFPGKADAWLLETESHMRALSPHTAGFAIARMQPAFLQGNNDSTWHIRVANEYGANMGFHCTSIATRLHEPLSIFAFVLMLALLALPATTSLPLGEYPMHTHRQPQSVRLRRWLFLTAKLSLLLPMLCFASLDISHSLSATVTPRAEWLQLVAGFASTLFALRWMLRDQRKRCPVCLQLLQNPVHVGQPSMNFLGWNGTELICVGGHGLLHVPELPTSWFGTQRWLALDPSWRTLFHPPALATSRAP